MLNARHHVTAVAVAGALLATILIARAGVPAVADALSDLGWLGLVWLCVLQLVSLSLCAAAWWIVADGASFSACLTARWVRDGASNLASILPGVGEVAGARALRLFGAGAAAATASTVIDVAVESLSQALYTIIGIVPLFGFVDHGTATQWLGALAIATVPVMAVYLVTRHKGALTLLEAAIVRCARLVGLAEAAIELKVADNVRRLYSGRRSIVLATLIHLAAWFMGAVQVWAAAKAMDINLSPSGALALESLVYATRGAFFMVPWGAGIQEASFVLVGAVLGLDATSALALSLALRARDLLLGVPAVVLWLTTEGRENWRRVLAARRS